ncbi:MAG: polysaccharide biosynthesis protein [Sphingobacteriales bacterium 17-39-43]|nr:MAG: polysaccharide biosynthesis protein [Sphingobacteriales bacterium 17-39-43]
MKFPVVPGFDQQAFSKYLKNTGWLFLARVGSLGIKILAGIAVANYLGKTANGMLNYPLVFVTFFLAAAALGLDGFVTRELLSEPDKKNKLLGTAFRMRLLAGIAIIPLAWLTYTLFKGNSGDIPVSYILIASCIGITQSLSIIDSYFQSRVQGKYVMMVQVTGNLLSAGIKLVLIFILGFGYLIAYRARGNYVSEWEYEGKLARYLLKHSWPLAFSAILVTVYMKIGQLMVESFLGVGALGIYSTVVNWSESWYFIPVAIVTSVFPAIMNARRDDPLRYQKRLTDMYDLMVLISLGIAIFMSFASTYIYQYFYAAEFAEGAKILSIHIWAGVFVFLGSASGQYLVAEGYTRYSLYRTAAGAVVNVVLGFFWIPLYGLQGAAFATLIAYFSATFFIIVFPETRKQGINMLKSLFLISLIQKIAKR